MSKQIDDGGQAFPMPGSDQNTPQDGMSLRDYFAAQTLAGLMADSQVTSRQDETKEGFWMRIAKLCYFAADAMIAARKGERHDRALDHRR